MTLLAPGDVATLERLALVAGRQTGAALPGTRPGLARGPGIDFADYRRYSVGDDVRAVDWTLFSRLGQLFCRTFDADVEVRVHVLLDVSASMRYGDADKLECARRLAASLSWVGLRRLDAVGLAIFSDRLHRVLPPARGRGHLERVLAALTAAGPVGRTDLDAVLRAFAARASGTGLVLILSDFLSAEGWREGLGYLRYRKLEPVLIRIVADEELAPRLEDQVELVDAEEPERSRVPAGPQSVADYRAALRAFEQELDVYCRRRRIVALRVLSSSAFGTWVRQLLRHGVWARR